MKRLVIRAGAVVTTAALAVLTTAGAASATCIVFGVPG